MLTASHTVLGSKRTSFSTVFAQAQTILRDTFGMELVELQTRAATQETVTGVDQDKKKKQPNASQANGDAEEPTGKTITGMKKKGRSPMPVDFDIESLMAESLASLPTPF